MPAESGYGRTREKTQDLDTIVSSFLEELDLLEAELQPAEPSIQPAPSIQDQPRISNSLETASDTNARSARYRQICCGLILIIVAGIASWFYFLASHQTGKAYPPVHSPALQEQPFPSAPGTLHDVALLLAGMPVKIKSPLSGLSETAPFRKHRTEMQTLWSHIERKTLAGAAKWQAQNIPAALNKNPVLYPLSGADFLNAQAFFPHAREYLLLALESPGEIPEIRSLDERDIAGSLSAVRNTLRSMDSLNYLQSKPMREDMTSSSFRGIVPLLLLFAARFGHTVLTVQPVTIGSDGRLLDGIAPGRTGRYRRVAGVNIPEGAVEGIRIKYIDGNDRTQKSITYLQMELKDAIFTQPTPQGKYLAGLKNQNTILKSAVYLLHGAGYGAVCRSLLQSSNLVVQDDSGIPYRCFSSSGWERRLFGTYTQAQPLGTIKSPPQQPELAERYSMGSLSLDFSFGYGALWGRNRSNMMLFIKKKP